MKSIQNRVTIRLASDDTHEIDMNDKKKKTICSQIITNKQWLQENILCLLSNAAKYS